ncbi:MAG: phosphonate ABC transporter ATP-binding protein [Chloroflexi bacterium]|nr:phosphonate ABC transporter ATP-binding protein [Chloroflexota bacterium]
MSRSSKALVFQLKRVSVRYGSFPALHEVDLMVERGECAALVGPSGAGKSTLLHLLCGVLTPSSGEAWMWGRNLTQLKPGELRRFQQRIGMIYQQFHLVGNLRVIHNINAGRLGRWPFYKALFSLLWPLEVKSAMRALAQVGIPEKLYERTDQLSVGQQQRVAIARVLVQQPQVILADEPISSLDPERGREIIEILRHLNQVEGKTLLVSLHHVEFALSHFQRVIGLRQGRILFDAPAHRVNDSMIESLYCLVD